MPIELNPTQALVYSYVCSLNQEYLPTVADISHALNLSYSCTLKNMQELVRLGLLLREKSTYGKAYYYRMSAADPVSVLIVPHKEREERGDLGPASRRNMLKFGY